VLATVPVGPIVVSCSRYSDVEAGADRRERREDHDVPVAPDERALAVDPEDVGPRDREVRPPAKVSPTPANATTPASTDHPSGPCTTALIDATVPMIPSPSVMMTSRPYRSAMCPAFHGIPPFPALDDVWPRHLEPDQRGAEHGRLADRQVDDRQQDPEHLCHRDRPDVRDVGPAP
jgi:hypothetical protein